MLISMRGPTRTILLLIFTSLAAVSVFGGSGNPVSNRSQDVPTDMLITLERTACYGMCPDYKLTISADCSVAFEGRRFVKKIGIAKSTISQAQLRELLSAFEKINYFRLRDRYEDYTDGCKQWWTDNPSAFTSIRINGKSKSVRHYYGCRGIDELDDLKNLEQTIDDLVNSAQWIR